MLTGEQRYWQAVKKAGMIHDRDMRAFLAGGGEHLECAGDRERALLIKEFDRAFAAGVAYGRANPETD